MALPPVELRITARDQTRAGIAAVRQGLTSLNTQIASLRSAGLKLGLTFGGLGLAVAPLVRLGRTAIDAADDLKALSERTGISVEKLSVLALAAKQSNTSIEAVGKGARNLSALMLQAAQGSEKAGKLLTAFGVAAGDTLDEALQKVLLKLGQLPAGWQKAAIGAKLLGARSAAELIPLANSLQEATEQQKRFNLVIGTESANAADAFNDGIELIKASLGAGFLRAITPTLEKLAGAFQDPAFQRGVQDFAGSVATAAGFIVTHFRTILTAVEALGGVFVTVFAARMVAALKTYIVAVISTIQQENARRALQEASLKAAVQSAAAEEARAVAMLNSARAAAVAVGAQARMNLVLGTVIPLERAAAASAAAHAAAQVGLAGAMGGTAVAGGLLRGALLFLGGPIGAITTALSLGATAWAIWGNTAQASVDKASVALGKADALIGRFNDSIKLSKAGGSQIAADFADLNVEANRLTDNLDALKKKQAELLTKGTGLEQLTGRGKLADEIKQTQEAFDQLTSKIAEARQKQGTPGAEPTFTLPPGLLAPEPKKAAGGGAGKAINDAKQLIDASLAATQDALEREQRNLDQALEDHLVSYRDFYARRTAIAVAGIDNEIAAKREALALAKDQGDAARLTSEITVLERKRGDVAVQARRDQITAERELASTVTDLRARLAEAEGRPLEARKLQIAEEIQRLRDSIQGEIPPAIVAVIARLEGAELVRAEFEDLQRQLQEIEERRHLAEQSIEAETATKLFGEFEQRSRLVQVYKDTAAAIEKLLPQLRALAAANPGIPDYANAVADAEAALAKLQDKKNETFVAVRKTVQESTAGLFTDLIDGTKKASDAFEDFAKSVMKGIEQILAQQLAKKLVGNLFGTAKGEEGNEGGGSGGGLFSFLSGLFHQGGIAGEPPTSSRRVPALAFAGAPRLHDGGTLGLRSNEVPAILQRGEEVLTRGDPRHQANQGRAPPMNLRLEVSPQALHMTLQDWLQAELGRVAANR